MPIQVEWVDDTQTMIVQQYPAKWSWDEFKELENIVPDMMRQVSHTVHVIGDYSQHQYLPAGNPITPALNLMKSYPDNFGLLIIITRPGVIESFVKAFMTIFAGALGSRIYIVHNWDQVDQTIAKYQKTALNSS